MENKDKFIKVQMCSDNFKKCVVVNLIATYLVILFS